MCVALFLGARMWCVGSFVFAYCTFTSRKEIKKITSVVWLIASWTINIAVLASSLAGLFYFFVSFLFFPVLFLTTRALLQARSLSQ